MARPRRLSQWGHYPPLSPDVQQDDSGIDVVYNDNGALEVSTDYGLIDTGTPGDGITFTGPDSIDGSYELSLNVTYLDDNYLRNDGDTATGDYVITGNLKASLLKTTNVEQTTTPASSADICFRNNNIDDESLRFMSREAMQDFTLGGQPYVNVERNVSQNISHGAWTPLYFNIENADRLGEFSTSTSRFTAIHSGIYHISCVILFTSAAWPAGKRVFLAVYKNGVAVQRGPACTIGGAVTIQHSSHISNSIELGASDYIDIRVYQDSGITQSSIAVNGYTWLTITRVG